jgi:hypothetical protein
VTLNRCIVHVKADCVAGISTTNAQMTPTVLLANGGQAMTWQALRAAS